jgi:hypothetical protein
MKRTIKSLLWVLLAVSVAIGQTDNMGRTLVSSQNVRYANEGGTGTTVNKLAKLTGAPSTAIITATTDTSGIVGIVVAGAGTTGSTDIAVAGKASCVFDSATTAGHYVVNDTSTAGDCMDAGATYPTSSQVIGVVTSTNGGAGTYEVDLSFEAAEVPATVRTRSFGASFDGGGSALSPAKVVYVTVPFACMVQAWNILVDTGTATVDIWRVGTGTALPVAGDAITGVGAGRPAIAANTAIHSTNLTGWSSTSIVKNDILGFDLQAVASAAFLNFVVECQQ